MIVKVDIRQPHIDFGSPCNAEHCAGAEAITDALTPTCGPVVVAVGDKWVNIHNWRLHCHTSTECPDALSEFIHAFDERKPVKPISFDLDIPDDFIERCRKAQEAQNATQS